jgi:hypothetical protein
MRGLRVCVVVGLFVAGCLVFARGAFAQSRAVPVLEATVGHAGFVDDATIGHTLAGAAVRWQVTPRLSVGPEVTYMKGPRSDRDLFVTGDVVWDLVSGAGARPGRVVPYLLGGAGMFRHFDRFGPVSFASNEGTFAAGGGARVWLTRRVYAGAEARLGWELHTRVSGTVGVKLGGA